jgi:hypothetical protein
MNPLSLLTLEPPILLRVLFLMVVLITLFLLYGATAAGVPVTAFTALVAALSMLTAQFLVVFFLSFVPLVGGILGFIFGILAMIWVLRLYFNVTWRVAAQVWLLAVVAEIASGLILKFYLGTDLVDFIHRFFFIQ